MKVYIKYQILSIDFFMFKSYICMELNMFSQVNLF
ncbi:hypothetical protein SEEM1594_02759 [Salmonella enterica subsp. enterica serovar Muenchen str. baa1594]|nr:hypothetical protein SEEM1594_02759 [Salmonella enterica subsp. enterica serovar Muenchen str. baa1594]